MFTTVGHLLLVAACMSGLVAGTTGPAGSAGSAGSAADWRTNETSWSNAKARTPRVVDLRVARHDGFDRAVVDLRGHRPGYQTFFVDKLFYDPSAQPVPLKGKHKMYLVLRPAGAYANDGDYLYAGPQLVRPGLPALKGIALTGSWEGDMSFGFTSRTRPYRVFTLTDPTRVVIDFKHPAGSVS